MSSPPMTPLRGGECAKWAIVLAMIQVVTFSGFFFKSEVLVPSDLLFEVVPWRDHQPLHYSQPANLLMYDPIMAFRPDFARVQEALREGRWPLWNNLEMGGLPLLANCQSRVFNPVHLLLLIVDVDTAMSLFVIIKLWLAALLAYACARLLGFSVWASRWYSIVWGLGCFMRVWAYWPIADVLIWAPVVFVGTTWLAEQRYRRGFFALVFGGTMLLFGGHPETAFAINAYMALYFVVRLAFARTSGTQPLRAIALYAGAWAMALGVYAVQLAPFLEYLLNCAPVEERIDMPLTASALVSFWVPRFFGTVAEDTFWDKNVHNSNLTIQQYAGVVAWLGAAIAVYTIARKRPVLSGNNRGRVIALLIATILSLAMAMNLSSLEWARSLPGFSHMRTIYHVYFALFAIPVLGLVGLEAWFARERRLRELTSTLITVIPAAVIVGLVWMYDARLISMSGVTEYVVREIGTTVCVAAVALAALSFHCSRRYGGVAWPILTVLTFCDVFWPVRGQTPSLPRAESFLVTPAIAYMQGKQPPCRFDLLSAAIAPGAIGNFGIEEWEGYDGLYPERPIRFRETLSSNIWDRIVSILGVDYYVDDPRHEELAPIRELTERGVLMHDDTLDDLVFYRHIGGLPRARLAATLETASSVEELFERMLQDTFDPTVTAISEKPPGGPLPDSNERDAGAATITEYAPERIVVTCDAKVDSVLVLAENYYPGWHAFVDGKPERAFPVYYTFRGVLVPRGSHIVEFRYAPASLKLGLALSTVAILVTAGIAYGSKARRRL